jgi:CubicO group peptidase (beta-lactamase class C family)
MRDVDALFAEWDRPDSPGGVVGVIGNGRFLYQRGYGCTNLAEGIPITPNTVFRVASVSKQFTAACIALLAEAGELSLDDEVGRYFPELPRWETAVNIRHLVHHTSGWPDYLELMAAAGKCDHDYYTGEEVLLMLSRHSEPSFLPGREHSYSNTNYFLLGELVRRVSGLSLRAFAEAHIFQPLGMHHSHFHDDHPEVVPQLAIGYGPQPSGGFAMSMTPLDIVGDGGLLTTIGDLLLWDQNFYNNRLGQRDPELVAQLVIGGLLDNGRSVPYAFGLEISSYQGEPVIRHSGSFVGYRAEMMRFPLQKLTIICLANLSTIETTMLAQHVADNYLHGSVKLSLNCASK